MIKSVNMLVWDDDYTHGGFVGRWRRSHAEFAREFPGLVKYATSISTNSERSEYDDIVESYFEDMAALKVVFDSEIGQRVNADAAMFTDMERGSTLYVEETVYLDRS